MFRTLKRVGHLDRLYARRECHAGESNGFGAVPVPVAVTVVDGENLICAGLEAADGKLPKLVGLGHAFERQGADGRIGEVAVDADHHSLSRLEILGLKHHAGNAEGIDCGAGGKIHGESVEDIALVEVADGVGEINGVGSAVAQRVAQFESNPAAVGAGNRLLHLGRRYHELVLNILKLYVLVEEDINAVTVYTGRAWRGGRAHELGGSLVARATFGPAYRGTRRDHRSHGSDYHSAHP